MRRLYQNDNFIATLLATLALAVYLSTLAPTVNFIDSGELAAVATTLGIAHPTGYPLFTLLGWLFAHLPLGLRTIYKLNLMSAVLCSLAVFFFYKLSLILVSGELLRGTDKPQGRPVSLRPSVAAAVGSVVLAFSETFWSQAVSLEVYSLHLLFLCLTMFLFCKTLQDQTKQGWWYAFAFTLGLGFTNHMTMILLAPGFLYLYFSVQGRSRESLVKILRATVAFLVGFSVYLYLPVRAAQEPILNWGNPTTLERFWWHFTGKQYRVWIFSSVESAGKQFNYFLQTFPVEFAYLPLVLGFIGVVVLFKRSRRLFWWSTVLFSTCLFYSINYDIHDIDSYFLLAYVVTALWIATGANWLLDYTTGMSKQYLGLATCLVIALLPALTHHSTVDESKDYIVEDYTRNMFDSLEPNALLVSYQWDYFISAAYYYQLVEGERPDVAVVDKELLRRSWYFKQLGKRYPWLIENSKAEVDAFLQELHKFEHDLPYNRTVIQARFEQMIHSFLLKNQQRPVYVTREIEPEFIRDFQRIPSGLAFRLVPPLAGLVPPPAGLVRDTTFRPLQVRAFSFRPVSRRGKYVDGVLGMYASSYTSQGAYLGMMGDTVRAMEFFRKALEIKPDHAEASMLRGRFSVKR